MAEIAGLGMGAIGLASVFSTCIECFDYFHSARTLEKDIRILYSQLDIEKTRLLIWGNSTGILKTKEEGRNPTLDQHSSAISKCLESINFLFSDATNLEDRYGLQALNEGSPAPQRDLNEVSSNSMNVFKTSYKRFWVRFARSYNRVNTLSRTRWAIQDKARFEKLISNLKGIIDGLFGVVPIQERAQNEIMERDIASIVDIGQLTFIQSACKNHYPVWSDIASRIISESEIGTTDRRNVVEWLQDVEGFTRYGAPGFYTTPEDSSVTFTKATEGLSWKSSVFFVIVPVCQNYVLNAACRYNHLGEMIFMQNCSYLPSSEGFWGLSERIGEKIDVNMFISSEMTSLISGQSGYDVDEKIKDDYIESQLPFAKLFFYCAPCICSIQATLKMSAKLSTRLLRCVVRVDDGISSSCGHEKGKSTALKSIIEFMDTCESGIADPELIKGKNTGHIEFLDRPWIEQRLFDLDDNQYGYRPLPSIQSTIARIFAQHKGDSRTAGIVILGEFEQCTSIMQTPPFRADPRPLLERGVYQMKGKNPWERKFWGTFATRPSSMNGYVEIFRNRSTPTQESEHTLHQSPNTPNGGVHPAASVAQANRPNVALFVNQRQGLQTQSWNAKDESSEEEL